MAMIYVTPPIPNTWPTTSIATSTTSIAHATTLASSTLAVTAAPTHVMTAGASSPTLRWYDAKWTTWATWLLFAYCAASVLLLYALCGGGCLDRRLNLDLSSYTRRARRRERQQRRAIEAQSRELLHYWADVDERADRARQRRNNRFAAPAPTAHRNDSTSSVATVLGQGDEPELAVMRHALAENGIYVSDRQLREQRRALEGVVRSPTTITGSPAAVDEMAVWDTENRHHQPRRAGNAESNPAEHTAEMERHREYRIARLRTAELQLSMTSEQRRRLQQSAQVEANMRAIGLI